MHCNFRCILHHQLWESSPSSSSSSSSSSSFCSPSPSPGATLTIYSDDSCNVIHNNYITPNPFITKPDNCSIYNRTVWTSPLFGKTRSCGNGRAVIDMYTNNQCTNLYGFFNDTTGTCRLLGGGGGSYSYTCSSTPSPPTTTSPPSPSCANTASLCTDCSSCTSVVYSGTSTKANAWISDINDIDNPGSSGTCTDRYDPKNPISSNLRPINQPPFCSKRVWSSCSGGLSDSSFQSCASSPTPGPSPPCPSCANTA